MQNVDFFYKKYPMKNLFDITCGDLRMTRQNYGLFLENILYPAYLLVFPFPIETWRAPFYVWGDNLISSVIFKVSKWFERFVNSQL